MQLNEALFAGSHGWLLKPDYLRAKPDGSVPPLPVPVKSRLEIELVGASNLERPEDAKKGLNAYIEVRPSPPSQRSEAQARRTDRALYAQGQSAAKEQSRQAGQDRREQRQQPDLASDAYVRLCSRSLDFRTVRCHYRHCRSISDRHAQLPVHP